MSVDIIWWLKPAILNRQGTIEIPKWLEYWGRARIFCIFRHAVRTVERGIKGGNYCTPGVIKIWLKFEVFVQIEGKKH